MIFAHHTTRLSQKNKHITIQILQRNAHLNCRNTRQSTSCQSIENRSVSFLFLIQLIAGLSNQLLCRVSRQIRDSKKPTRPEHTKPEHERRIYNETKDGATASTPHVNEALDKTLNQYRTVLVKKPSQPQQEE